MSRLSEAGVVVASLGLRPGPDTTLDVLRALASCDRVFHDVDEGAAALLARHCRKVEKAPSAAEIVAAARGERVGLALRLTPPWGGALAEECRRVCAREKIPFQTVATISPLGGMVAQAAAFFGGGPFGALGLQAFEVSSAAALKPEPAPWLPLVVYAEGPGPHPWAEVARWLSDSYRPSHRVKVCAEDGRPMGVSRISELGRSAFGAAAVFIPPSRKAARIPTVHVNSPRAAGRRR